MTAFRHLPIRVVVIGGGVAALETCLALRDLAGGRVAVTLVASNSFFVSRPQAVHNPLAVSALVRTPVARVARAAGADLVHDRVVAVEPASRLVYLRHGTAIAYDALVVAVGAVDGPVPEGTVPYDGYHSGVCRLVMQRLREGDIGSVAFVEPPAPARALDFYDLVLEAAMSMRGAVSLVTSQVSPMAVLGARTAGVVHMTLAGHGVRLIPSSFVSSVGAGLVELTPGARRLAADSVVALPRLVGPRLDWLSCDRDGFVATDLDGRVPGVEHVFAAGDCTTFPVKHPSLAGEQAVAVATTIAAEVGAPVTPAPFGPVLRGMLPARRHWFLEIPLKGGEGDNARISSHASWPGDARFGTRYLVPWLAAPDRRGRRIRSSPPAAGGPLRMPVRPGESRLQI
jgi:sulfide:quinone oxidoreductase